MVLTYLHQLDPEFPSDLGQVTQHKVQSGADTWDNHPRFFSSDFSGDNKRNICKIEREQTTSFLKPSNSI